LQDGSRDVHPDVGEGGLVHVDAGLVPLQEQVVFDARIVRLREAVDQRGIHVPVHRDPDGSQPLLLERDVGADLGL
jgi:hypothetical protein